LNDGENGLIPMPTVMWMPPPLLGSGKFGTPCDRMHSENARNWASALAEGEALGLLEEPQAASTATQLSVESATDLIGRLLPDLR
jgi:hypothetical protein